MDQLVEISRLLENLVRYGVVASVDHAARRCTVRTGKLVTPPVRWLSCRAGDALTSWAPSEGEQVVLLSPGGDIARGTALPSLYSDDTPAPTGSDTAHITIYPDGACVSYDPATHELRTALPSGGKVILTAPAGVTITGDTHITGALHVTQDVTVDAKITASDDVIAGSISLKNHVHGGVQSGTSPTTKPQ